MQLFCCSGQSSSGMPLILFIHSLLLFFICYQALIRTPSKVPLGSLDHSIELWVRLKFSPQPVHWTYMYRSIIVRNFKKVSLLKAWSSNSIVAISLGLGIEVTRSPSFVWAATPVELLSIVTNNPAAEGSCLPNGANYRGATPACCT